MELGPLAPGHLTKVGLLGCGGLPPSLPFL